MKYFRKIFTPANRAAHKKHRILFRIGLILCLIMLLPSAEATARRNDSLKASLYNILAIIQNSYISPTENWRLLNGAITGLDSILPENQLKKRQDGRTVTLSFPSGTHLTVARDNIQNNAYQLIENMSRICRKTINEFPGVTPQEVLQATIKGIVSTLDSHSSFISAEEFSAMRRKNKGIFGGIGVEMVSKKGVLTVVSPFAGTPADLAGLQANDQIFTIDGQPTKDLSLIQAISMIRGPGGTKVKLTVLRGGWLQPREFSIVRQTTTLHSVKSKFIEPGFVYLQIISFLSTSFADTQKALRDLSLQEKIKGLVLDLRNNPGGLLDQSENIADMFIAQGMIVYSRGQAEEQNTAYEAHRNHRSLNFPIVVLVNEGSASGSEMVAASLKENNRALILGCKTFGKGTIQTIFPVLDGAALRLTTAEFFTPHGHKIEEVGVLPNVIIRTDGSPDQKSTDTSQAENNEDAPPIPVINQTKDSILKYAVNLLKCARDKPYEECVHTVQTAPAPPLGGPEKETIGADRAKKLSP